MWYRDGERKLRLKTYRQRQRERGRERERDTLFIKDDGIFSHPWKLMCKGLGFLFLTQDMQRATIFIFMFKWHHQWTYLCDLKIIMKRAKVQIPHFFLNLSLNFDLFFLPPWVWVQNSERRIVKTTMPKCYGGYCLIPGLVPPPPGKNWEMEY